jgi:uncharacterized coiled-coil DUF342 family protein
MGKLRKTIQREIYDILDSSIFTSNDFNVTFGNPDSNEYLIIITFKHNTNYSYKIAKATYDYRLIRTPGDIEEKENTSCNSYEKSISYISLWCSEVRNELKAEQPIYNEIDSLRKMIEENIIINNNSNEAEFSVKEINDLQQKFEDLQTRVEELEKNKIITESQSTNIKNGLQRVKEDIEYYPKDTWIKTASNKVVDLFVSVGKSKEGRKILAEGGKKLLGLE